MKRLSFIFLALVVMTVSCSTEHKVIDPSPFANDYSSSPSPETTADVPSDEKFDEWQINSNKSLIKRWLAGEDLDNKFIDLDWPEEAKEWISDSQRQAHTFLIDVDNDGKKDLAYQTACAVVGNCEFYLYRQFQGKEKLILSTSMVQRFKLRKTKTHGFFDLETSAHGSASDGGIAIFRYDGSEYKISECYSYEYIDTGKTDEHGQAVRSDKPHIEKASCTAWSE